jgi:hypothetical protein
MISRTISWPGYKGQEKILLYFLPLYDAEKSIPIPRPSFEYKALVKGVRELGVC